MVVRTSQESPARQKFLLAGASGFLGMALRLRLAEDGQEVVRLVRHEPRAGTEFRWDPERHWLDPRLLAGVDVVVNLAGCAIERQPWTPARRALIRSSRIEPAATLAKALANVAGERPITLVQASGVAWYGTTSSDVPHDEDSSPAEDFLAQLCVDWEAATQPASEAGVRTVILRTSPVLDASGGVLQIMRIPWSLGLGAQLGDGTQHMPLISLTDYLRAVLWLIENPTASGPYNLTIPQPATNAAFTVELARQLHRPVALRAPRPLFRRALGELADQLLGDMYIVPRRLAEGGFRFLGPDVSSALRLALHG